MRSYAEQATAEFVGTLALVFIGAGSVVILSQSLGGGTAVIGIALAHGLVLAVMVTGLGHISGGHFNPAVTVGAWVAGKIESARAGDLRPVPAGRRGDRRRAPAMGRSGAGVEAQPLGATLIAHSANITNGKAVLLEAVMTFFLVFTVFATVVDDRGAFGSVGGFPIGLVLTFDILVGGVLTGGSMNPARTFGPALVAGKWADFWVYWPAR